MDRTKFIGQCSLYVINMSSRCIVRGFVCAEAPVIQADEMASAVTARAMNVSAIEKRGPAVSQIVGVCCGCLGRL